MLLKKEEFYLLKRTKVKNCKIISFSGPLQERLLLLYYYPSFVPLVPLYLTSHGEIPSFILMDSNMQYWVFTVFNTALPI